MQAHYDVLANRHIHCSAEHSLRNAVLECRVVAFTVDDYFHPELLL